MPLKTLVVRKRSGQIRHVIYASKRLTISAAERSPILLLPVLCSIFLLSPDDRLQVLVIGTEK